jgi:O-antigen/teichoic acid export membrane protein
MDVPPECIVILYAVSYFIGSIIGILQLKLDFYISASSIGKTFRLFWLEGRWALLNEGLVITRQQAHIFVTAVIIGPIGVGLINAAKMFMTPIMLVTPSLSQVYLARLVALRESNIKAVFNMAKFFSSINAVMVLIYGAILFLMYDYLTTLFASEASYSDLEYYIFPWFLFALICAFRYGLESAQKAVKNFKLLTIYNVPVAIISLSFVTALAYFIGANGAIYGLVIAETVFAILLFNKNNSLMSVK